VLIAATTDRPGVVAIVSLMVAALAGAAAAIIAAGTVRPT